MSTQSTVFAVQYTPELIDQAAVAFRDYQFKRYGPALIVACIVNAVGLALSIWFGIEPGLDLAVVVFIVVIGPTWLLYKYFANPRLYAARLKTTLPFSAQMSVDSDSVSLVEPTKATIPWAMVKVIVETNAFFLLVISPFAFTFIPSAGLPSEIYETLHAKSLSVVRFGGFWPMQSNG